MGSAPRPELSVLGLWILHHLRVLHTFLRHNSRPGIPRFQAEVKTGLSWPEILRDTQTKQTLYVISTMQEERIYKQFCVSGIPIHIYHFSEMFGGSVILHVKFLYNMNSKRIFLEIYIRNLWKKRQKAKIIN